MKMDTLMHLRLRNSASYTYSISIILPSAGENARLTSALILRGGLRKKSVVKQKRAISVIPRIVLHEILQSVISAIKKYNTIKIINAASNTARPSL